MHNHILGRRLTADKMCIRDRFGLVLVIGTVVDNAIVVVERVTFIMDRDKCSPEAATIQAMKDVTAPMTATTLVFLAIFVPVGFMGGITGQIYKPVSYTHLDVYKRQI